MLRFFNKIEKLMMLIGGIGAVIMMLHVTADVIGKYLFHYSVPLTIEMVSYYYMVVLVFLPFAALERQGAELVHVELLYDKLSKKVQRIILPAALIFASLYCIFASWAAWKPAIKAFHRGTYAGSSIIISTWPTRFIPIIGFALLAIVLLIKAARVIWHGIEEQDHQEKLDLE